MKYLPVFTQIRGQHVLVVGGGDIALRKVRLLMDAGAMISIVSPDFDAELLALAGEKTGEQAQSQQITLVNREFVKSDITHSKQPPILVIAATDDEQVNEQVADIAKGENILINAVDAPAISTFIFPAIVDRSPIVVAISSGGDAPVLVRRLREKLESLLPQHLGPLGKMMGKFRAQVKTKLTSLNQRRGFWEDVLSSKIVSLVGQKRQDEAQQMLENTLDAHADNAQRHGNKGEVYIVGGGPGDPDLLTIKALQLMQQADVVVYDGLISPAVLNLVRRDADRICVSKSAGNHSVPQDQINDIIIEHAKAGRKVCRLKGGDPFIFGRGGEEVEQLVAAGIDYQIVPGITAAAGCSAYAGIPLTHRDYAQGVQFVTGHCRKDGAELDWQSLAKPNQTLVVYMGLINSGDIVAKLMANGRQGSTPVALIERGTCPTQRVVTGTLSELQQLIKTNNVKSPALIVVGEVVALQQKLQWFASEAMRRQTTPMDAIEPLETTSAYAEPLVALDDALDETTKSAA